MLKTILIWGTIGGLIVGSSFFIFNSGELDLDRGGVVRGYITMVIALSSIFFAIRQYRDNYLDGKIKFGKAFLLGLGISAVAGLFYSLTWELYTSTYDIDFAALYMEHMESSALEEGLSQVEVDAKIAKQAGMMNLYKNNTPFRMLMSFGEMFPVGLAMSLIAGIIFSLSNGGNKDELSAE
ncbi:MAG: hypothetical protein ACI959_000533 [Limisphaerales bacterium]|jgi:hypothetical protein